MARAPSSGANPPPDPTPAALPRRARRAKTASKPVDKRSADPFQVELSTLRDRLAATDDPGK
eukprot:10788691-Prorocentrum_lima.AAC.1